MEEKGKRSSQSDRSDERESSELSIYEAIRKIAEYNANADLDTEHQLLLYLKSWWSKTYNRPLKDPLLLSYTLEELLYEFYDKVERVKADATRDDESTDRIEEDKIAQNLDWAEQEEQRELEELRKAQDAAAAKVEEAVVPAEDPDNKKWMQEIIDKEVADAKEIYGEDFGEDIDEDFNG